MSPWVWELEVLGGAMSIKLAPKEGFAEIPEDVLEKIKELRLTRARQITTRINELKISRTNTQGSYRAQQIDAEIQGLYNTFLTLKKVGGGNVLEGAKRGGLSDVMMRMRRLPFEKFYLKSRLSSHSGQQDWIIGLTKQILCKITISHRGIGGTHASAKTYDMGKYFIAILCQAIGTHQPTFHLMPESDPTTMARHMHHHVSSGQYGNMSRTNPLDWTPANCYGSYSAPIHGAFMNADIPELFRMLYLFTSNMNPNSPLLQIAQLPHVKEVKT